MRGPGQQSKGPSIDLQRPLLTREQDHLPRPGHQPHQEQAAAIRILII